MSEVGLELLASGIAFAWKLCKEPFLLAIPNCCEKLSKEARSKIRSEILLRDLFRLDEEFDWLSIEEELFEARC